MMQTWKATTIQLASTTSMAKSILPCGQAKTNKVERDREMERNTRFIHFDDPFVMQTHTDAIVRSVGFGQAHYIKG